MDKTHVITAVVSAITSLLLKSMFTWIASLIKETMIVKAITAKIKIAFSKTNRAVIFDIFGILFYVAVLINFALDKSEPTRFDILIAIGAVMACVFMSIVLLFDISKALHAKKSGE